MTIHKAIKRSRLRSLMLCGLLILSGTLQILSAVQFNVQESYDYTLQNHADQVSPIEKEAYLDIAEMPDDLATIFNAIPKPTTSDAPLPQLLAMVGYDSTTQHYSKYLFASNGLLSGSLAQQKAHKLNYHLVKAPEGPVIWQVLSFLDQRSYLEVQGLVLPESKQLCLSCGHMAMHLFHKKLPMQKAGCQGQPFPPTASPAAAIACFYSKRFTDQQRRLVISQIGDQAFPDPKKLIVPPPTHHSHKPTFQPIKPAPKQDQLHMAVQLNFPIETIKLLLTSPQIEINTLDSSDKTPLDYATQSSDLYLLLVGHSAKTSQELTQNQASLGLPPTAGIDDQKKEDKAVEENPSPPDQLLIPANGQCLYTTVIMGYLLPVRQVPNKVNARIDQLFGLQPAYYINPLYQTLENPTHYLTYLRSDAFSSLVTAFMARMQIKKGTWGGPVEIQTIATKLKVNIQTYYPDPSNPNNLVQSDLTKPAEANADISLHIVQDKVHPREVLTQVEKASASENQHYQHYRLKYPLPPSIPAIGTPFNHSSNNQQAKPALIAANLTGKQATLTFSKENDYKSNHQKESRAKSAPQNATHIVPSPAPINTDTTIHPLKSLLEDTPHEIAWQGWVAMAAYGGTLQKTYAIVTIEGLLYTLQNRPTLYTKSHIAIERTIHLEDYGFVLNIDMHKLDSFVLAQVNPNNTHTLTTDNTFTLDTPTTDTLENEVISHIAQNNVSTDELNRFLDWLVAEEVDEEAVIADIIDDELPDDQSNIYQQFPALYKLISEYLTKLHKDNIHPNTLVGKDKKGIPQAIPLLYALRTIPHAYFYVDAQDSAIYALGRDTTLVEDQDKDKPKQEAKATQDTLTSVTAATAAPPRQQRDRNLNASYRRPLHSRSGWARHTTSATQHGMTIDTAQYHLVPFLYQVAGDHTATTTCYCLVPPSYKSTYQNLVKVLTTHQGMSVQQLTYLDSDHPLQDKEETINWHIAKQKAFQVYFDLAPYFLQTPDRILWKGWIYLDLYGEVGQQSYCLITDDDKLYTFGERPEVKHLTHAKAQRTIDLSHYSFVHNDPNNPKRLILSQTNTALQQPTAANTLTCYTAASKFPPIADEYKSDTPPINNDTLLHTLRRATHLYHYITTNDKQPKLCAFSQTAPLHTSTYRLVQISCQTPTHKTSANLYCLLPPDYQPTYQTFSQLWQAYFHTDQLQLTYYQKR